MHKANPEEYQIGEANLFSVRNRNELRVIKILSRILAEEGLPLSGEAIYDLYALTLNALPARYVQSHSIVLRDPVTNDVIENAIRQSLARISNYPKS